MGSFFIATTDNVSMVARTYSFFHFAASLLHMYFCTSFFFWDHLDS